MKRKKIIPLNPKIVKDNGSMYLPVLDTQYMEGFIKHLVSTGHSPIDIHEGWKKFIKLKEKNTPPPTTDDVNVVGALLNYFQNISVKVAQKHYVGVLYYAGKD